MGTILNGIAQLLEKEDIIQKEDVDVCRYGLEVFTSSFLEIISILIFSAVIGNFFETLIFFIAFIPLRIYAGGYHADTKLKCYLVSLVVYGLFTVILKILPESLYMAVILPEVLFTLIVVLTASPVIHHHKNVNIIEIHNFRKISMIICITEIFIILLFTMIFKNNLLAISLALGQLAVSLSMLVGILKAKLSSQK